VLTIPAVPYVMAEKVVGRPWTAEEDNLLIQAVAVHGQNDNWKQVALSVPGRTNKGGYWRCAPPTKPLLRSAWDGKSDLFPVIILAVDSDCLDQKIVFFRSPGLPTTFSAMNMERGMVSTRSDSTERVHGTKGSRISRALISPLLVKLSRCSSSAVFDPPCPSSKATPLTRTEVPCLPPMMPLDSLHFLLQKNQRGAVTTNVGYSTLCPRCLSEVRNVFGSL